MKKVITILCIFILISLIPTTLADNSVTLADNPMGTILIMINSIDDDGHVTFQVTNGCRVDLDDVTIDILFQGACPVINRNFVDINTEICIENLASQTQGYYKTTDQIFNVLPIIRRPVVMLFGGWITASHNGYADDVPITKMMAFIRMPMIVLPYVA